MESLPQEIIDKIAAHVHDGQDDLHLSGHPPESPQPCSYSRGALACISRRWQVAFERQAFRFLQVKSSELEDFDAIVQGERRGYLLTLNLVVVLPPCSEDTAHLFEQNSDRQANDEAFSSAFHRLFRILSTWSLRETGKDALSLRLQEIYSPSDPDPEIWPRDIVERYIYSYLHLRRAGDLPFVPVIRGFDTRMHQRSSRRCLAPQTGLELLARMPMVRSAILALPDSESRYSALRRRNRDSLLSVLQKESLPSSLEECLGLAIVSHPGANQTWRPTNLLTSEDQPDAVSSAIWEASSKLSRLRQLSLRGTMDPSILWPGPFITKASSISRAVPAPFWQNITAIVVHFDPRAPSGEWYFRAPDGIDVHDYPFFDPSQPGAEFDTPIDRDVLETEMSPGYNPSESPESITLDRFEWHLNSLNSGGAPTWIFRLVPEDRLLLPLIEAWARALSQMQQVSRAKLKTTLPLPVVNRGSYHHYDWSLRYLPPCKCSRCSIGFVREGEREGRCSGRTIRGLSFRTLTWRPEGAHLELLTGIGSRYHGGGMEFWYHDAGSLAQDLGL